MTEIERSWADKPRTRNFPTTTERTTTMKHFTKARTITVAVATASAVVLAGGVAYAFWSSTGTGAGTGKAKSAVTLTVAGVTGTADLYPGLTTGAVSFTIQNTNPYNVNITRLASATVVSDDTVNCPTANISITTGAIPGTGGGLVVNYTINAGATSATQTISGLLTMATTAPDGCQGKTFTATLNFTGTQI